jgi:tripartite-type tricarboxylate transporter receptor subunit TctC
MPDVPTTKEAGLPIYTVSNWFGMMAPKGTPPAVLTYLQQNVERVLAQPDVKEKLLAQGASPLGNSPADAARYVRDETELWKRVIRDAKIEAQ